jgi:tRNA (cytidine/uridine-2'-O-)-methyltransferase
MEPLLHIALYHPEIPPNTGNIGRLCLGIQGALHIVHPIAFAMDDKQVRRAGLDYWKSVALVEHESEADFWSWADGRRVHLFSTKGARGFHECQYQRGDVLLFGCETTGLPQDLIEKMGAWTIPMTGEIRSLNLANAAAVAAYGALAQIQPDWFLRPA